nr:sigma factor [Actinocrinis puniceicyclus]
MGNVPLDFEEFATATSGRLFRAGCVLTGDWHLAEDLVQETLGKLYRSWRRVSRTTSDFDELFPGALRATAEVFPDPPGDLVARGVARGAGCGACEPSGSRRSPPR